METGGERLCEQTLRGRDLGLAVRGKEANASARSRWMVVSRSAASIRSCFLTACGK